ncbi:MAG: peptidase domain protein [Frankiales bacterium]|jgi:zinc protease|nr:peptidase domain protein [Frankiales bacterium]
MTTAPDLRRPVPPLAEPRPVKLPSVAERTLDNGLRVLAVRRPGVPLAEVRLRIPFAGPTGRGGRAHTAQAQLLGDTLLAGTDLRTAAQLAADVQALGGQISASTDADRLGFGGSVLVSGLPGLLEVLAEVLTSASYPKREVVGERDRLVQELAIYRSQPAVVAREALMLRLYGEHPYGRELPTAQEVADVKASQLRALHGKRIAPAGSVLTIVGDLTPARAIGLVEKAMAGWTATTRAATTPPLPEAPRGPALLVDRPGAVQTTLRMAGPAPSRTDPDSAAFGLVNLVFGGYFSSRWVANIREDKGYTYSPHAQVEHPPAGSRVTVAADVSTPTTAPALLETLYELGRVATLPVTQAELDQARRYAIGTLAMSTSTQAGLASTLSQLAGAGLGVEWLRDHPVRLAAVTVEDALEAGARYLAPAALTTVLVGDVAQVEAPLRALLDLELG